MARILIVEDSADLLDLLTSVLEDEQHQVVAVAESSAARAHLRQAVFDVILSDLAVHKGEDLADEDRAWLQEARGYAPVVLLTGVAWAAQRNAADLGLAAIVPKPFELDSLLSVLKELLDG